MFLEIHATFFREINCCGYEKLKFKNRISSSSYICSVHCTVANLSSFEDYEVLEEVEDFGLGLVDGAYDSAIAFICKGSQL